MTKLSEMLDSLTWKQNFRPYVNKAPVRWEDLRLNMTAGESLTLELNFEYSYLIGDPDALIQLCAPAAKQAGLVCDPPFGQLVEMAEGLVSLTWTVSATTESTGEFELHFEMPHYQGMPLSPAIGGDVLNFGRELEIKFDEFLLDFGANAYPCHGAEHTFTILPKADSRLLNKNIKLMMADADPGVVVTPLLANPQLLEPDGVTWTLDCRNTSKDGGFTLRLSVDEWVSAPFQMVLAHNLVRVTRWSTEHAQWPEWTPYRISHIHAISEYLNSSASFVQVIVNNGSYYGSTNSKGEYSAREAGLKIYNRYNDTIV